MSTHIHRHMRDGSYLDAERCAALEKLLYVVEALAVVLRFLVNLERRKRGLRDKTSSSRVLAGVLLLTLRGSVYLLLLLLSRHAFYPVCVSVCVCAVRA